jgi:hypothetical protein
MKAQGWYRDPYLLHEDRWFSDGQPTQLVRDAGAELRDPPPPGPPQAELVEVPHSGARDDDELPGAGDHSAAADDDNTAQFRAVLQSVFYRLGISPGLPRGRR